MKPFSQVQGKGIGILSLALVLILAGGSALIGAWYSFLIHPTHVAHAPIAPKAMALFHERMRASGMVYSAMCCLIVLIVFLHGRRLPSYRQGMMAYSLAVTLGGCLVAVALLLLGLVYYSQHSSPTHVLAEWHEYGLFFHLIYGTLFGGIGICFLLMTPVYGIASLAYWLIRRHQDGGTFTLGEDLEPHQEVETKSPHLSLAV